MGSLFGFSAQEANLGKCKYKISGTSQDIKAIKINVNLTFKRKQSCIPSAGMEQESPRRVTSFSSAK